MRGNSGYVRFWEDTAKALTVLVCGHAGTAGMDGFVSRCSPFLFRADSRKAPFALRPDRIQNIFGNGVLFDAMAAILNAEAERAWPERQLGAFCLLNPAGRPVSPREMAEIVYFSACEEIMAKYSGMSGVPLNHVALLASMAYEKNDFEPGTQICFGGPRPAAFTTELGAGSRDTVFNEENLRTVRKLLSGVKKDKNALYFGRWDSGGSYEYRCGGCVEKDVPAAFRVTFYGDEKWGFRAGGAEGDLFTVKNRQVQCFDAAFRYALRRLREEFRGCGCASGEICRFLEAARKQTHGTSVVLAPFSAFPAAGKRFGELERAGRGRSVAGAGAGRKDSDFYQAVTALARVDGSLVVDLDAGGCRFAYFGVILDGRVGPSAGGWASAGARANSVLTFVQDLLRSELEKAAEEELAAAGGAISRKELRRRLRSRKMPVAAVIFSEDGYVTPVLGGELAAGLCDEAAAGAAGGPRDFSHTP